MARGPGMVKAVLFDLDGTLFDRDSAVRELACAQHDTFHSELGGVDVERYVERLLELDEHGHGDKRNVYPMLVRELGLEPTLAERLLEHFRDTYARSGKAFDDALPTLGALRSRGIAVGLVSNGRVDTQRGKLRRLGLEPYLDVTVISEAEGLRKPDRRIFALALERLGVAAAQAWHVGDHPTADVAGAHAAGLIAVWRYVPYWPEPATQAFTIFTLAELLPLLEGA